MKTMKYIKILKYSTAFTLTVFLLIGCASRGKIIVTKPLTSKLTDYKTILICVLSQVPDSTREIIELESIIVAMLQKKGLFEKVIFASASPDASADLQLNANIVTLKEVGFGAKFVPIANLLPRSNSIVVDAEIVDFDTGKTISTFTIEGKSKKAGVDLVVGLREEYTSQAIKRVAEEIIDFIQKNIKR